MITELLIKVIILLLSIFNKILPSWSIPEIFTNAISTISVYTLKWNTIFPLKAMINVLLILLTIHIVIISYNAIVGLLSLIRGGGGQNL